MPFKMQNYHVLIKVLVKIFKANVNSSEAEILVIIIQIFKSKNSIWTKDRK